MVLARRLRADRRGRPRAARLDDGRARAQPRRTTRARASRSTTRRCPATRSTGRASRSPAASCSPRASAPRTALDAHCAAVPGARLYAGWDDFTLWVLEVERVRWVGGFATMDTLTPRASTAPPSPTRRRRSPRSPWRTSTRTTRDGLLADRARDRRRARRGVGRLHRHRPLRHRPELHRRRPVGGGARAVRRAAGRRPPTCARRRSRSCSARARAARRRPALTLTRRR